MYAINQKLNELIEKAHGGVGLRHVTKGKFEETRIEIPPFAEQHRIVAKIEELLSELDKGVEDLKTAHEQLLVYRQSVLKHAFEGRLTADWRRKNKSKLKFGDQLSAFITKEREARYRQQLTEWKSAVENWKEEGQKGKKPLKPRVPKPLSNLADDVVAVLPAIPEGWLWEKLGWMTCGVDYGTAAKSSETGLVPVIRMGNLQNGIIDWQDLAFTSDEAEIAKYSLVPGDVLFNRTNSPELVGKTAIYQGERPALFAGYLIRVNHIESVANSQYLNLFLCSHVARRYGNTVKTDGVNQSNINGEKLQGYPFPYCSLPEQCEIVRILSEKLSLADQLMRDIDAELAKSEALRQSILKKAFSGRLVAHDPNDEPASVLLERIKAGEAERDNKHKNTKNDKRRDAA